MKTPTYPNTVLTSVVGLPVTECAVALLEHGIIDVRAASGPGWARP